VILKYEMKSKILTCAVIISFSLFVFSRNLTARERRGAELIIQKQDGQQLRGELIAVKQNSLLLLESISGADVSADIGDIALIRIIKESKAAKGALFGFLAGAGVGIISAAAHKGNQEEDVWAGFFSGIFRALAVVLSITAGTLIGLGIGAASGKDQTIMFEGKSPEEIRNVLGKLRTKARIPNFQ
jgi:hypothetical protein